MPKTKKSKLSSTVPLAPPPSASGQPDDEFEMKASTRDKIIENIQTFLRLLKESKSSQKDNDAKRQTDMWIRFINLLINLGEGKHEFNRKRVKHEENGEHSSEADQSDEQEPSVFISLKDKDDLINNLIRNRGYVDQFCDHAEKAGDFKKELSNVLSLLQVKRVEDSEMEVIYVENEDDEVKVKNEDDLSGDLTNGEVSKLKAEVEKLRSEVKTAKAEYEMKLNKKMAQLKKELGLDGKDASKKNADPRLNALEKRAKDKETLEELKVEKVSEMFEAIGSSKTGRIFTFNKLKFQLNAKTKEIKDDPARNGKYLSFNLQYCENKQTEAQINIELRLLSQLQGRANRIIPVNYTIRRPGLYGFSEFIRESKLFDENFGFVKNDTIYLQAYLRFEK